MHNPNPLIPSRPEIHRVADVGEALVALQFKKWGWTADLIASDYGEDLACDVFVNGKRTAFHFRCQVKSTFSEKGQIRRLKSGDFSVSITSSVCSSWAQSYYPIILAIYDDLTERIYWRDVSQLARDKAKNLRSKTTSIRVPNQELQSSKCQLEAEISKFYSNLLNLSSFEYTCQIIPVLMPALRSFNSSNFYSIHNETVKGHQNLKASFIDFEQSPSWITSIKSMDGRGLNGWEACFKTPTLESFFKNLEDIFLNIKVSTKEGEWLAYVISPVKFQQTSKPVSFWTKNLTAWSCYCVMNGKCFSDFDYSFELPDYFLQPIARHARSWDGLFRIDTEIDLAFQIFSGLATTPAYREYRKQYHQQILGKFIPWTCKEDELEVLADIIDSVDLVFQVFDSELLSVDPGCIKGIISLPMFCPDVGLIPLSETWDEFEVGDVMRRLAEHQLFEKLPGEEGGEEIIHLVMQGFASLTSEIPSHLLINESQYVEGMPLDHNQRIIMFQRFILAEGRNNQFLTSVKISLESKVQELIGNSVIKFSILVDEIETFADNILEVTISLEPRLYLSSTEVISRFKESIAQILTDVGFYSVTNPEMNSVNILKKYGELYFEGDSPWGIRRLENE